MTERDSSGRQSNSSTHTSAAESSDTGIPVFPVVGIGASAGGLAALELFFSAMPADCNMAFVVVMHLPKDRKAILPQLLQNHSSMPVLEAEDNVVLQENHVYTIPASADAVITEGRIRLFDLHEEGPNRAVNQLFRSLGAIAAETGGQAIGILLSGTGSDGTEGCRAIKCGAGMVIVQDSDSAEFDGMPRHAIAAGVVDFVLSPAEMPAQLLDYVSRSTSDSELIKDNMEEPLRRIFLLLRARTGHDFSQYKRNTIIRRIERRMLVQRINSLDDYMRFLKDSDREPSMLFDELLINVTGFFRDPEVFETLKGLALPKLIQKHPTDVPIRVWVAGCASGEEAYSIAILFHECMEQLGVFHKVQIFATDLDSQSIEVARAGCYSDPGDGVSRQRLERYFMKVDGQFQLVKMIRAMVIFAPQNVTSDPPFTRMDLISCRNLLIYFQTELQQRIIPLLHYSLNAEGILLLGSSETIGNELDLFEAIDYTFKLFRKKSGAMSGGRNTLQRSSTYEVTGSVPGVVQRVYDPDPPRYVEAILEQSTIPPCVIVDSDSNIVFVHGRTGKFLEPAAGATSVNVVEMARPGLRSELITAIRTTRASYCSVTRENVELISDGSSLFVNVQVSPLPEKYAIGYLMIVFHEVQPTSPSTIQQPMVKSNRESVGRSVEQLEEELHASRDRMQAVIEEMQAANEELRATNEELQSTNEELQSTNEELETSKEELQSLNEESVTVNTELQARIEELSITNDDIKNLLDSTNIATVFLDINFNIRRYTPRALDLMPLEPTDVGRPVSDLATTLEPSVELRQIARQVLDDLVVREVEVASRDGGCYLLRVRPYRTISNMIDGVVLTFEDVSELKRIELGLQAIGAHANENTVYAICDFCEQGVVIVDSAGKVVKANMMISQLTGYSESELAGMSVVDLADADSKQIIRSALQVPAVTPGLPGLFITDANCVTKNGSIVPVKLQFTSHVREQDSNPVFNIVFVCTSKTA